ncbi:MAG: 16S rRNA pseudouridine(516) synthase [Cognaticolwellia aestuarii]
MPINHTRIDKFIAYYCNISKRAVRLMVAQKRITVDDCLVNDVALIINRFSKISLDGKLIQNESPTYIMLNKPVGVVSATKDGKHPTVIDLVSKYFEKNIYDDLHIVGRLDLNTSGLVLLTNDSRWSSSITSPNYKISKHYRVSLEHPITSDYIDAFEQGMYFPFEDITTKPAKLKIIDNNIAIVTLIEGRYHQIKRIFGRFRNPVIALHRLSIGEIKLDKALLSGESRLLTQEEIDSIYPTSKTNGNSAVV